jgi:SAM-dependent methyltransferase
MTGYELFHRLFSALDHPLHQHVGRTLRRLKPQRLLDVGGRRSHYTTGVPGQVWISDIPREQSIQHQLDLGATDEIREAVLARRSNVADYIYDDMTRTKLPAEHFDCVSAVEVLEHVDEDEAFVANVAKVLQPGGHFVMSTPNGDFRPVPYPDHVRHYRAADLESLLRRHFRHVRLEYRAEVRLVNLGWKLGAALRAGVYALSALLERIGLTGRGPNGKLHLFAVCIK